MNDSVSAPVAARQPVVLWVIAVLLALCAGALLGRSGASDPSLAYAQAPTIAGARGVYAFAGQIGPSQYGLYMMDIEQGTVWLYEIQNANGTRKLSLSAARTWIYDRYLRDFNCAAPDFRTVQQLVARERADAKAREDAAAEAARLENDEDALPARAEDRDRH